MLQNFVSALEDPYISQRILEMGVDSLDDVSKTAEVLRRAKIDPSKYDTSDSPQSPLSAIGEQETKIKSEDFPESTVSSKEGTD